MKSNTINEFISKVQSKILEIRSWPEYIPDEDLNDIPTFELWYDARKDEFTATKQEMHKSYLRLRSLAMDVKERNN
jgi:hypothetical protein